MFLGEVMSVFCFIADVLWLLVLFLVFLGYALFVINSYLSKKKKKIGQSLPCMGALPEVPNLSQSTS